MRLQAGTEKVYWGQTVMRPTSTAYALGVSPCRSGGSGAEEGPLPLESPTSAPGDWPCPFLLQSHAAWAG